MFKDYTTREQRLRRTDTLDKEPTLKEFIFALIVIIVVADMLGAMAWALHPQTPITDGYYLGKFTTEIIKLII